jgi:hypothetical protein
MKASRRLLRALATSVESNVPSATDPMDHATSCATGAKKTATAGGPGRERERGGGPVEPPGGTGAAGRALGRRRPPPRGALERQHQQHEPSSIVASCSAPCRSNAPYQMR